MIKSITIGGFKSIRDQTVELDPVTVLVGRSGTGKSNFVQAIRFLRDYLVGERDTVQGRRAWERIARAGSDEPRLKFDVTFRIPAADEDYRYRLTFMVPPGQSFKNHGQLDPGDESLSLGAKVLFHRTVKSGRWEWRVEPALASKPSASELALPRLPAIQEVVYAHAALTAGIGYYHLPSSVLEGAGSASGGGADIAARLPGLRDDAANYLQVMRDIVQDYSRSAIRKAISASLRQVNPGVVSVEVDSVTQPQAAIVAHRLAGGRILDLQLGQESDGFRRFYGHLLALYQPTRKLLNIFEEPENAIYPGALSLLADEFKAAPADGRGQVILTTHSPGLLDRFDVDSLRVVEMRDGETIIGRVAREQREAIRENLLTTGELLTADPARIEESQPSQQKVAGA